MTGDVTEPSQPGIVAASRALREGRTTSVALTEKAIALARSVGAPLNAFVSLDEDGALAAARAADEERAGGRDRGPLHGIPLAVKDVIATLGLRTTAGSSAPKPAGFDGSVDADCVHRLREAGMVVIGKTSTMEFAKGLPDPDGAFPIPRNPWDLERWPGGSSCGSGAAVAAGIVPAALGTDTGGSVRMPAAYCGVTGFKPTHGALDMRGCLALAPSLDHLGILSRSVDDCAVVFEALHGAESSRRRSGDRSFRVLIDPNLPDRVPDIDAGVYAAFLEAVETMRACGATVVEAIMPDDESQATRIVTQYENYQIFGEALRQHGDLFGKSARQRLEAGEQIGGVEYERAMSRIMDLGREYERVLAAVDVMATPTTPAPAETLADLYGRPRDRLSLTRPWNALGLPAVSVPMRPSEAGLPQGLQFVGRRAHDRRVLEVGAWWQSLTVWHRSAPDLDRIQAARLATAAADPGKIGDAL